MMSSYTSKFYKHRHMSFYGSLSVIIGDRYDSIINVPSHKLSVCNI